MSTSYVERSIIALSAGVVILAVATRVHDVAAFPALHDFDAPGHALNVVELFDGHLPNPRSWSGSQPPLYHALGAALWAVLPEQVPVHVTSRLISVASWVIAVALVWRVLRRIGSEVDAAVVAALLLGAPGILIGSCMMTNDALCALFVTATLVRLLPDPGASPPSAGHAAVTGIFAGLAALAKLPGLAALGIAAAWYAWQWRRSLTGAVRTLAAFTVVAGMIAGPHYARLVLTLPGSLFDIITDMAGSQEKRATVAMVLTSVSADKLRRWMPAVLHVAVWGDPVGVFLPHRPVVLLAMFPLLIAGPGVVAVAVAGTARVAMRRELAGRMAAPLAFGAFVAVSLLRVAWIAPSVMVGKPTYMLPAVLPVGIVLVLGVGTIPLRYRTAVRGALVAIAAAGSALTWYGWWAAPSPASVPMFVGVPSPGSAVQTVERYFTLRAEDPIRALTLVDPEVQLVQGLRLAHVLKLDVGPEQDLSDGDERVLEVARGRVAWMDLYHVVTWLRPVASALKVSVISARQGTDDAQVSARVSAAAADAPWGPAWVGAWPFAPFEQDFTLHRDNGGWRITAIEQRGVGDVNIGPAFVAYPTLTGFERLPSLGWRPSWEPAPRVP